MTDERIRERADEFRRVSDYGALWHKEDVVAFALSERDAAILEENEACARLAETPDGWGSIASAIRTRMAAKPDDPFGFLTPEQASRLPDHDRTNLKRRVAAQGEK